MKARIRKIEELDNALHPNNIPVGNVYEGEMPRNPEIGSRFYVGTFSTSAVQEILPGNRIRTLSSIYEWELIN